MEISETRFDIPLYVSKLGGVAQWSENTRRLVLFKIFPAQNMFEIP